MTTHPARTFVLVCVAGATPFFPFFAAWVMQDMLSLAGHYGNHPPQLKDFPQPGRYLNLSKTKDPDQPEQVLSLLSCHRSYFQSSQILAVMPVLAWQSLLGHRSVNSWFISQYYLEHFIRFLSHLVTGEIFITGAVIVLKMLSSGQNGTGQTYCSVYCLYTYQWSYLCVDIYLC